MEEVYTFGNNDSTAVWTLSMYELFTHRYRKSSKKMFFPTSHFKVFLRQMSRLHSKAGDDISLKDIPSEPF